MAIKRIEREMVDYTYDADDDLNITGGDLVRGECTYAHQRNLLLCGKGEFTATPTVCVDVERYIDNDDKGAVKRAILQEFQKDGMTVEDLSPNPDSLSDNTVNAFPNAYYI